MGVSRVNQSCEHRKLDNPGNSMSRNMEEIGTTAKDMKTDDEVKIEISCVRHVYERVNDNTAPFNQHDFIFFHTNSKLAESRIEMLKSENGQLLVDEEEKRKIVMMVFYFFIVLFIIGSW